MAKAEAGKTYAVIQEGRCHSLFTSSELPEWNANHIQAVDVTGNVPSVGDAWNGSSFAPYVPSPAEAAAKAKAAVEAAEKADAKADNRIQAFVAKTNAEHRADIAAITNLADAKQQLRDLTLIVAVLARREFR